jgi:hypothetical protein
MNWIVLLLLLALLIPVLIVLTDAIRGRRRRPELQPPDATPDSSDLIEQRLRALEDDVSDLTRDVGELRDELYTLQRQLESRPASHRPSHGSADDR